MLGRRVVIPLAVAGAMAVGAVAGAVLGVPGLSGASTTNVIQTAGSSVPGSGKATRPDGPRAEIEAAAKALNLTTEQLLSKLSDGTTTIADVAKQQNVEIDTVIDAIAAADRQRIEDFVNNPLRTHDRGRGAVGKGAAGMDLEAVAKALEMTPQELITELRGGKSIAEVAQDKGVDLDKVIDAMVTAGGARIDKAKDAGKITQQEADDAKAKLKERVTKIVNGELPEGAGPGFGFRGGRGLGLGHFGGKGGAPNVPKTPSSTIPPPG